MGNQHNGHTELAAGKEKLYEATSSLMNDTKDSASILAEDIGTVKKTAKDTVVKSFNDMKNDMNGYYEKGQAKLQEVGKKIEGQFKAHPVQTVLIAIGVGFSLNLLRKALSKIA